MAGQIPSSQGPKPAPKTTHPAKAIISDANQAQAIHLIEVVETVKDVANINQLGKSTPGKESKSIPPESEPKPLGSYKIIDINEYHPEIHDRVHRKK